MEKSSKKIWFAIVGIICIGMSIKCYTFGTLPSPQLKDYGKYWLEENAYEGIQHATAITASNVSLLQEVEKFVFGSAFLVVGIILLDSNLPKEKLEKDEDIENPFSDDVELN